MSYNLSVCLQFRFTAVQPFSLDGTLEPRLAVSTAQELVLAYVSAGLHVGDAQNWWCGC